MLARRASRDSFVKTDLNTISNKELNECDREKLHLLGNIQDGVGHVFYFSYPDQKILAADSQIGEVPWIRHPDTSEEDSALSASSAAACAREIVERPTKQKRLEGGVSGSNQSAENGGINQVLDAHSLLGCDVENCVPAELVKHLLEAIDSMGKAMSRRTFRFFTFLEQSFAISVSTTVEDFSIVCVEIEESGDFEGGGNFYNTLVSLGSVMESYADEKILKTACDTVYKLLGGYDRGMVYQFNDDLSGEVVHEVKKDHLTSSYMGMRFPATDIPKPARELYVKNGLRYIYSVDADYNPIVDNGQREIDLSNCRMRAVAKPHIVYLRNMGVISSLSIAIVVDRQLWGLLAFHGYTKPFKPSLHQRIACESIMSMVSVKVESIIRKSESGRIIDLSDTLMRWEQSHSVAYNMSHHSRNLLEVFDADVIVGTIIDPLSDEPERVVLGDETLAPKDDSFWKQFESLPSRKMVSLHTRDEVTAAGVSEASCPASGFVYFQDNLVKIMVGRGIRAKDVCWAGNPDEPKLRIGGILNPRNSFEIFMEKARKETKAWTSTDLHVISTFMDRVCDHSHNRTATLLKNDIEDANIKYFDAMARSEDNSQFFAQMSHELRTPFHGVMGCLNIMHDSIEEMTNDDIQDLINTALSTGNHMIGLLNDILNISKDRHLNKSLSLETVLLKELATEPIENLKAVAENSKIILECNVKPDQADQAFTTDKKKFMQIIANLVNNGIKFSEGGKIDLHFDILESMVEAVNKWGEAATSYAGTVYTMSEDDMYDSVETARHKVLQLDSKDGHKWILTSVRDTGCGMKPGELAEMLKPYTQSSRGTNRAFQGTGLGLFICVSLCHQLGGFIACSSTQEIGTVFHVGIPVKFLDEDDESSSPLPDGIPKVVTQTNS